VATTLIYAATIPASQAQGAPGSTIDHMVDHAGVWGTNASAQATNGSFVDLGKMLALPQSGTSPEGLSWSQPAQAVVLRWTASAGNFYIVLNYTGDGLATAGSSWVGVKTTSGNSLEGLKVDAGSVASAFYAGASFGGLTTGHAYVARLATAPIDSGNIALYVEIADADSPLTPLAKYGAAVAVNATVVAGGVAAIQGQDSGNLIDGFAYYRYDGDITVSGADSTATDLPPAVAETPESDLSAPTATIASVGTTTAAISATASTSSAGPITYQLVSGAAGQPASAMTPVGSPSSALASGVAPADLTLSGLAPGTWHYLAVRATDSFAGTPGVRYSRTVAVRTYANSPIAILFTGDSIGANAWPYSDRDQDDPATIVGGTKSLTLPQMIVDYLRARLDRDVVSLNRAFAGATSGDWDPEGGYWTGAVADMQSAMTAAGYSGDVYVSNMLGANDAFTSVSASTYQSNTAARLAAAVTLGWTPIEHYPAFVGDGAVAGLGGPGAQGAILADYPAALAAAVAAVPGSHLGDASEATRGQFARYTDLYQRDRCHPLLRGLAGLARSQAEAIAAVVDPGEIDDVTGQEIIDGVAAAILASPTHPLANDASGRVLLQPAQTGVTIPMVTAVGTVTTLTGYVAPDNATITAIAGYLDTEVAAIKAKTDNLPASPAAVGSAMTLNLAQTGLSPRDLGAVADGSLTVGDALVAAIAGAAGKQSVASTSYVVKTPSTGTVIRTFTLDSATTPTSRT
jgi:hypothetical protein